MRKNTHKQWEHIYTRPILIQDFESWVLRSMIKFSQGKAQTILLPHEGKAEGWIIQPAFNRLMTQMGSNMVKKSWNIQSHVRLFEQTSHRLLRAARSLGSVSNSAPLSEYLKRYRIFQKLLLQHGIFVWQPWSITYFVEDYMVTQLQKYFDNWQELYDIIARAPKPYQIQRMFEAVWRNTTKGKVKNLKKIVAQFKYLGVYSINHQSWTERDILKQVGSLRNADERLKEAQAERHKTKRLFLRAYKEIENKNNLLARVAETVHIYVWLRTERIDRYKQAIMLVQPFYRKLEKRMEWKRGWGAHLTVHEIERLLQGKTSITGRELKYRHEHGYIAYISQEGTTIISDPQEQKIFLKNTIGSQRHYENIVTGKVACPGKVHGRVVILRHAQEAAQFPKGAILVANMTHPDYMPAIRKATAIVTDEGGIVCHAAVIARELNIPCVIATKHATKIFKTGDRVEVDAIKGIVRKLA